MSTNLVLCGKTLKNSKTKGFVLAKIKMFLKLLLLICFFELQWQASFTLNSWANGLNREHKTEQRSKLIKYKVKCTDKKWMVRAGLEPRTFRQHRSAGDALTNRPTKLAPSYYLNKSNSCFLLS